MKPALLLDATMGACPRCTTMVVWRLLRERNSPGEWVMYWHTEHYVPGHVRPSCWFYQAERPGSTVLSSLVDVEVGSA